MKAHQDPIRVTKFSKDRRYRYYLYIKLGFGPNINFILLNPSTADEVNNDPTVSRCIERANSYGYGGVIITNIFALRSTQPSMLYKTKDPIGPENDINIIIAANESIEIVCGWGNHGTHLNRGDEVREMMGKFYALSCLKLTSKGQPSHPLYLPYSLLPKAWRPE